MTNIFGTPGPVASAYGKTIDDRERSLRAPVERVTAHDPVVDVWTEKSFTDRLYVVD